MTQSLLDIFHKSGDAHVGRTLVRLARLAEAAHQYEYAMTLARSATDGDALNAAINDDDVIHAFDDVHDDARSEFDGDVNVSAEAQR